MIMETWLRSERSRDDPKRAREGCMGEVRGQRLEGCSENSRKNAAGCKLKMVPAPPPRAAERATRGD